MLDKLGEWILSDERLLWKINFKNIFVILLRSIRGLCEAFGLITVVFAIMGTDSITGEWYIKARFLDLCNKTILHSNLKYVFGLVMVLALFGIGYMMDLVWCEMNINKK